MILEILQYIYSYLKDILMANEYDGKDLAALSDEQLEELIKNDKKKDDFIKIMNYIKDNNVEDSIFLLY